MTPRLLISSVAMASLMIGCARQPATTQTSAPAPVGAPATVTPPPAAVTPTPSRPSPVPAVPAPGKTRPIPAQFTHVSDVADIHFDFDRHEVRPTEVTILEANARWLHQQPDHLLLIEGHCDERGTTEYNLALGERRAKAAMNYLVSRGVRADRITIVSYGEDRPTCTERSEPCRTKNRRAHFKVKPR
jgi:peptidoglycan-associated lipoprotein